MLLECISKHLVPCLAVAISRLLLCFSDYPCCGPDLSFGGACLSGGLETNQGVLPHPESTA